MFCSDIFIYSPFDTKIYFVKFFDLSMLFLFRQFSVLMHNDFINIIIIINTISIALFIVLKVA